MFHAKPTSTIGLELGSSAVKAVELRAEGDSFRLVTYGSGVHDQDIIRKNATANADHIVHTIRDVLEQSRVTTDRVVVSLPAMNVFHTTFEIPAMAKKDLESAIQWEARRMLPLTTEKMSLDWHPLSETPTKDNTIPIILTAAPKDVVHQYITIIKDVGLSLVGMETEINALQRSLLPRAAGNYMVIDIGASNTNTAIFTNLAPMIVRNINVGSTALRNQIASALNITPERAASVRQDIGLAFGESGDHPATQAIKFVMDSMIIKEVRRVIDACQVPLAGIILAGGAAHLKGAAQYFQEQLQLPTSIGNPWTRVQHHPDLTNALGAIGPEMSVAVGLAMKIKKSST